MANKTHQYNKRQVGEAYTDLTRAISHIAAVGSQFSGIHPEIENVLILCVQGIDQVQKLLQAFAFEAWGTEKSDLSVWGNTGQEYRDQKEIDSFLDDPATRELLLKAIGNDNTIEHEE